MANGAGRRQRGRAGPASWQRGPTGPASTAGFHRAVHSSLRHGVPALHIQRRFRLNTRCTAQIRAEAFNRLNHPNFGQYLSYMGDPDTFGVPTSMMNRSLGGLSPLYQIGGPRSMQLSLRIAF